MLKYTLNAGYLPLYASGTQTGAIRACLFYWAYTRDDQSANRGTWPVSFLFNGGPVSSSDWIQFGGLGPKKLELGPQGITVPDTPTQLVDDPSTLLADSDLVFIEPINAGLSRAAQGVDPTTFNGLDADADSIGDFIQGYLDLRQPRDFAEVHRGRKLRGHAHSGARALPRRKARYQAHRHHDDLAVARRDRRFVRRRSRERPAVRDLPSRIRDGGLVSQEAAERPSGASPWSRSGIKR